MRNLFLSLTLASAALLPASGAFSQTAPQTSESGTPAAKPAKEKKICRYPDNTTTRLARPVCKTKAEWDGEPQQNIDRIKRDN